MDSASLEVTLNSKQVRSKYRGNSFPTAFPKVAPNSKRKCPECKGMKFKHEGCNDTFFGEHWMLQSMRRSVCG